MLFSTLDYLKTHFGCDPNKNLCSKVVCELLENEALAKPLDRMDVHLVCGDLRLQVVSEGRVLVTEEQLKRLERQPAVKFYVGLGSAPILPRMQRVTGTLHLPGELGRLSERVSERAGCPQPRRMVDTSWRGLPRQCLPRPERQRRPRLDGWRSQTVRHAWVARSHRSAGSALRHRRPRDAGTLLCRGRVQALGFPRLRRMAREGPQRLPGLRAPQPRGLVSPPPPSTTAETGCW